MSLADGLLHLLRAEPSLLPPAPTGVTAAQMEDRRQCEVHPCLRCGEHAQCTYVASTKLGPRWLDLCWGCSHWLRSGLSP